MAKASLRHKRRIQERAYHIWEQAGRPEGQSVEHWLQAEAEIAADERELSEELETRGRRRRLVTRCGQPASPRASQGEAAATARFGR